VSKFLAGEQGGCSSCEADYVSYGPARFNGPRNRRDLKSTNHASKCVVASENMLLNCDNKETNFERICPCLPTGPAPEKYYEKAAISEMYKKSNKPDLNV